MSRRERRLLALAAVIVLAVVTASAAAGVQRGSPPRAQVVGEGDNTAVIAALLSENEALRAEMESLDAQIREAASGRSSGRLEEMAAALNTLRLTNGAVAAGGPGVEVRLSGQYSAAGLRDLLNELKSGGAEALAIDGRRLSLWSAVYQGRDGVLLDGHLLGDVVVIEAIGDVATLREVLARRGGLVALLERDGAVVEVVEYGDDAGLTLPMAAAERGFAFGRVE